MNVPTQYMYILLRVFGALQTVHRFLVLLSPTYLLYSLSTVVLQVLCRGGITGSHAQCT